MKNNITKISKEVISGVKPSDSETKTLEKIVNEFTKLLDACLKKNKISAGSFVGGSIAKNTIIMKKRYDLDIFVRFNYEKYKDKEIKLGSIMEKAVLDSFKQFKKNAEVFSKFRLDKVHGSRDYFNIYFFDKKLERELIIEIVPTLAIKKPEEAKNITDLSFFHVKYIANKLKKKKIIDDILLAKAFCHAQGVYGAESHIRGFSGYAIEILVLNYGGFERFIKNASSWKERIIIDTEKRYRNNEEIMTNLNEAKLQSPVIVIDPTYSLRNVCASVSKETFEKFVQACKKFVKNPGKKAFEEQKIDEKSLVKYARSKKAKLSLLNIEITKEKEDIAAAKIVKFANFIINKLKSKNFKILRKEIEFLDSDTNKHSAIFYIVYKQPSAIEIVAGPPVIMKDFAENFKNKYGKCFVKSKRLYAKTKRGIKDIKEMVDHINKGKEIKDMDIGSITLVK